MCVEAQGHEESEGMTAMQNNTVVRQIDDLSVQFECVKAMTVTKSFTKEVKQRRLAKMDAQFRDLALALIKPSN